MEGGNKMKKCVRCKKEVSLTRHGGLCTYCVEDWKRTFKEPDEDKLFQDPEIQELLKNYQRNTNIPWKVKKERNAEDSDSSLFNKQTSESSFHSKSTGGIPNGIRK
jgi:hypothetical protein